MEEEVNIENIDNEIKNLRIEKKRIKQQQDRNLRLRSNNRGKSNMNRRVSRNFKKELDTINEKRASNGLDFLSEPKITELIIKHNKCWRIIKSDIILYNTSLDNGNKEDEFNEQ